MNTRDLKLGIEKILLTLPKTASSPTQLVKLLDTNYQLTRLLALCSQMGPSYDTDWQLVVDWLHKRAAFVMATDLMPVCDPHSLLTKIVMMFGEEAEKKIGRNRFQLSMTSIKVLENDLSCASLNDPKMQLQYFIVSDDGEHFIDIAGCLSAAHVDGVLRYPYFNASGQTLTENERVRLLQHSAPVKKYYQAISDLVSFKTNGETVGAVLHQLAEGLRAGGVHAHGEGKGTDEMNAGSAANDAISVFFDAYNSWGKEIYKQILPLQGNKVPLADVIDRLRNPPTTQGIRYCSELLAGIIDAILEANPFLYSLMPSGVMSKDRLSFYETRLKEAERTFQERMQNPVSVGMSYGVEGMQRLKPYLAVLLQSPENANLLTMAPHSAKWPLIELLEEVTIESIPMSFREVLDYFRMIPPPPGLFKLAPLLKKRFHEEINTYAALLKHVNSFIYVSQELLRVMLIPLLLRHFRDCENVSSAKQILKELPPLLLNWVFKTSKNILRKGIEKEGYLYLVLICNANLVQACHVNQLSLEAWKRILNPELGDGTIESIASKMDWSAHIKTPADLVAVFRWLPLSGKPKMLEKLSWQSIVPDSSTLRMLLSNLQKVNQTMVLQYIDHAHLLSKVDAWPDFLAVLNLLLAPVSPFSGAESFDQSFKDIITIIDNEPLFVQKPLFLMLNKFYREARSDHSENYLSCWGNLFGYSRDDKVTASQAIEKQSLETSQSAKPVEKGAASSNRLGIIANRLR